MNRNNNAALTCTHWAHHHSFNIDSWICYFSKPFKTQRWKNKKTWVHSNNTALDTFLCVTVINCIRGPSAALFTSNDVILPAHPNTSISLLVPLGQSLGAASLCFDFHTLITSKYQNIRQCVDEGGRGRGLRILEVKNKKMKVVRW